MRATVSEADARVTPLELFFDLVFVFALTQITALMADDLSGAAFSWRVAARPALVELGRLRLARQHREGGRGSRRAAMIAAMAAMFVLSLAIPEAFTDMPGGLPGPVVIALCYFAFRAVHLGMFWFVGSGDDGLRHQLVKFAPSMLSATALLLVASQFTRSRADGCSGRRRCWPTTAGRCSPARRAGASLGRPLRREARPHPDRRSRRVDRGDRRRRAQRAALGGRSSWRRCSA